MFILLRRDEEVSGRNRLHRLFRAEGLPVRKGCARHNAVAAQVPNLIEAMPNARWSTGFVHDPFTIGWSLLILTIVGDVTAPYGLETTEALTAAG